MRELQLRNGRLVDEKLTSLRLHHERRRTALQGELSQARDERIRRMKEAELRRAEEEFVRRQHAMHDRRGADILGRRLAVGILEVRKTHA